MTKEKKMAEIRSTFSAGANRYDVWIRKVIPRYEEMLDVLVSCIPANRNDKIRAIDIGCGTGALSLKLLDSYPRMELTCLDMTESMLDLAKERTSGRGGIRFFLSDIYDFEFDGSYDLAISSLALHHIVTDEDKKWIYQRIFNALSPGGAFLNADIVLGSDDCLQGLYMEKWIEFLHRSFTQEEVDGLLRRYCQEDFPAKMIDHLRWLNEVGFRDVDVIWKGYNYTVYGGKRI
jgi:tRNA (cmo5U34)-methyltransferase